MLIAGGMSTGYDKPQTRAAESAAATTETGSAHNWNPIARS